MSEKPQPMTLNRARQLRRDATPRQRLLWSVLRDRRLGGLKFRRQESIGPYVVDFCCREGRVIVEVDGSSHEDKEESDAERARWLEGQGYCVLRVTNVDVMTDLDAVTRHIAREAGGDWGG